MNRIAAARAVQGQRAANGAADANRRSAQNAFGSMLRQRMEEKNRAGNVRTAPGTAENAAQTVNFSRHALARAAERGIELTPALMEKLSDSVEKAQEKGAKNILAFDATQAFIINIPYGRVITAMSQEEMKENIFTNIDGAVLL